MPSIDKPASTKPLQLSGALDQFDSFQITPCIGTEYVDVDLATWITGPDSDALLRDLAITIGQRGVVFFRAQNGITGELQKELTQRLGLLSGKPAHHGLSKHPLHLARGDDPELGKLDPGTQQSLYAPVNGVMPRQTSVNEWHTDGSYEPCPPDFTILRMTEVPPTGGDTLWASGYELYDRLTRPYQKFFETLQWEQQVPSLQKACQTMKPIYDGERGAPENVGLEFKATHPAVRTHPVTGWKSLFVSGLHTRRIKDVTETESQEIFAKALRLVTENHDLQVRFRWNGPNDMAIWDNRCVLHCPTQDHYGLGGRAGFRTMGIGEKPYFDPLSVSRKQALAVA
ncbi:putative alpha-ketoglutarate-dependent sulfonate dioxygenase [Lophiotrema nucula]|uniref:Putative alpha-ketoglutarate-dependent sulfonate dioxygenase n=1 Tax=Lophiotrema nucula TaxID=690887 RepID=A0A6A5YKX6_9PLEO|nr:putative alpha-ketoglutarate-dependent sulfonate dioxygenase [Lophiotrema nucula]